jgi:alpha-L-fucosidase
MRWVLLCSAALAAWGLAGATRAAQPAPQSPSAQSPGTALPGVPSPASTAPASTAPVSTASIPSTTSTPSTSPSYASWDSIDARAIPAWFNQAKFGVFVCWGPYAVPSWVSGGYAEWYWKRMQTPGSAEQKFHQRVYGKDFRYEQFAPMLTGELFDPNAWADLFARAGARYVVTTANYHDGFCLWPSPYSETAGAKDWNAAVTGPKRDVLGQLFAAGTRRGLRMGIYYSLYEWYHPLWLKDRPRYVAEHLHPQFKDVVTRYKPWFIFLDGEWEMDGAKWRSLELAAWLYNQSPCKDYVVVNDRWGACRGKHGDIYESEYGGGNMGPRHPWQEDRGIGQSYGYNRNERAEDYDSAYRLLCMLSKVAGNGGNLLLDVGPTADGRIPVIMQDRLLGMGRWLAVNGEAIYGTTASPFWPRRMPWGACTYKPGRLYLHLWGPPPGGQVRLRGLKNKITAAYALADPKKTPLPVRPDEAGPVITPPPLVLPETITVLVVEIEGEPVIETTIRQAADGAVALLAEEADLVGPTPQVEAYDGVPNIGHWQDPKDSVRWTFQLDRPGEFEVLLTASCAAGMAGSEFTLTVADARLPCKTVETGAWNEFAQRPLGRLTLDKAGKFTLTVQPSAKPKWKSLGLRTILLRPAPPK